MLIEDCAHGSLIYITHILQVDQHDGVAVLPRYYKESVLFIFGIYLNLVMPKKSIHNECSLQHVCVVGYGISYWKWKLIFGVIYVQITPSRYRFGSSLFLGHGDNLYHYMLFFSNETKLYKSPQFPSTPLALNGIAFAIVSMFHVQFVIELIHSDLGIQTWHIFIISK